MASKPSTSTLKTLIHEKFNASDTDVIFQSSDGVQFHLHRKNLECTTGSFPGEEFDTKGEVVHLTEPKNILEILFQYIYPKRHPNLEDQDFKTTLAIAEAVEKYEVFPAINTCITRLRHYIEDHPLDVLVHGLKHDQATLIDEAASLLIGMSLTEIFKKIPSTYLVPWLRFCDASRDAIFGEAKIHLQRLKSRINCTLSDKEICNSCRGAILIWITNLETLDSASTLRNALSNYKTDFRLKYCKNCPVSNCCHTYEIAELCQVGLEKIPRLTSFLSGETT